jgi:hypothetical protein
MTLTAADWHDGQITAGALLGAFALSRRLMLAATNRIIPANLPAAIAMWVMVWYIASDGVAA